MKVSAAGNLARVDSRPDIARPQGPGENDKQFGQVLRRTLEDVNRLQLEADAASAGLVRGEVTDLHQVTIAAEKANLALQLTLEVRQKVLEAYQEIMRMQV